MFILSSSKGTGKTKILLEKAFDEGAIVACRDTIYMRERAYSYGIVGINLISYEEFDRLGGTLENVYLHDLHSYLEYKNKNLKGYSVCNG